MDDYAVAPSLRNDLSALLRLQVRAGVTESIGRIPVKISDMQANAARGSEQDWSGQRFRSLCAEMDTPVTRANSTVIADKRTSQAVARTE